MSGRVGRPQVIDRLDQAASEHRGPEPIDHGAGKIRVFVCRQPVGECDAGIIVRIEGSAAGKTWLGGLSGARMRDRAPSQHPDVATSVNPRKNGGQAVVIVLRPAVERMIVAVGTADPDTHEDPAHIFGLRPRVVHHPVEIGGAEFMRIALGGQKNPREIIQRRASTNLLAQPGMKRPGHFRLSASRANLKQSGEPERPVIGELVGLKQSIQKPVALFGRLVREEVANLVGRRQTPRQIQPHPTQECYVISRG